MMLKPNGLLESVVKKQGGTGLCETCGEFVVISETAYGCAVKDKLIMPQYIPHDNTKFKCNLWKARK